MSKGITAAYTGTVGSAKFIRTQSPCSMCEDCCACCDEADLPPGTYLTIRLDGDPGIHMGRVSITYLEDDHG